MSHPKIAMCFYSETKWGMTGKAYYFYSSHIEHNYWGWLASTTDDICYLICDRPDGLTLQAFTLHDSLLNWGNAETISGARYHKRLAMYLARAL